MNLQSTNRFRPVLIAASFAAGMAGGALGAQSEIAIDGDDIGGVVRGKEGPEAGVWVIAETEDLPTRLAKIVVTDDQGRYLLPDLPKAKYKVWVRGYGLVDSERVDGAPGKRLDLKAQIAPSRQAAAEYYPAHYWWSLLKAPAASEFPGTGPSGNGILPAMKTQQYWIGHISEGCQFCHEMGSKMTRVLPPTTEGWAQRLLTARWQDAPIQGGELSRHEVQYRAWMNNNLAVLGRKPTLALLADWSDRIAKGETPEQPPRPQGVERNATITLWDWAEGQMIHDSNSTDKRSPTMNAYGPVTGVGNMGGVLARLDPRTAKTDLFKVPSLERPSEYDPDVGIHTNMMDQKGRTWSSAVGEGPGPLASFCTDGSTNKYAAYFPREAPAARYVVVYDEKANPRIQRVEVCFSTHHLNFDDDEKNTLYFSGDFDALGWIETTTYDETRDWKKSIGWCPFVLDTNGDGKITPDRTQWNQPGQPIDPTKDTRMSSFPYGMGVDTHGESPAVWIAKFTPQVPSGIFRIEIGKNPPETCKTEYYEVPAENGLYKAFNARGADVDSKGIAWVGFGSGQIGRFDRSQCKIRNGPKATGQHCPEGWKFWQVPGPSLKAETATGSTEWLYLSWVDKYDTLGLGKDVPIFPGSNSSSFVAFLPAKEQFVRITVPYPLGVFSRGVDGRIDDPKAGWKGRGLWSSYNPAMLHHVEGGAGTYSKVFQIQLRPDPLAH